MRKCKLGVEWKANVAHYTLNAMEETLRLEDELLNGTYKSRKVTHFTLYCPKKRDIACISFRDRVYQRCLNDNILYPEITRHFIYDNAACQKGKGTDFARNRLKEFLHSYYRMHGRKGYVSQFDIHGYYPNMSHEIGEGIFRNYFNDEIYNQVLSILHYQYPIEIGYNPGSQLIQLIGIGILNDLDHYIKEQLHIRYYIRFMDDFILIHDDLNYLEECTEKIKKKLKEKQMTCNEKKTKIYPLSEGIPFLGFNFRLTETGKVVMLIDPKNVKNERKRLRRLVNLCRKGRTDYETVRQCYESWKAHACKGNSFNLLKRMDEYYNRLWR